MRFLNACASDPRGCEGRRSALRAGLRLLLGGVAALGLAVSSPVSSLASSPDSSQDASPDVREAPASFEALLALYDSMAGFESGFEEERTLALIRDPLRSRGRLYFDPPSTLLRRIEEPRPLQILVARDEVRIRKDGREQVVDLKGRAEVRPLVESLLWLFAGDRVALERVYSVEYELGPAKQQDSDQAGARAEQQAGDQAERQAGDQAANHAADRTDAQSWVLRLRPRSAPLDRLIRELRIRGSGRRTEMFEFIETSGDRTRTRLIDPDTTRRFDADERARLFGSPADAPEAGAPDADVPEVDARDAAAPKVAAPDADAPDASAP